MVALYGTGVTERVDNEHATDVADEVARMATSEFSSVVSRAGSRMFARTEVRLAGLTLKDV